MEADPITAVGALADPHRRALYQFVVDRGEPVSRDDAAQALGLSRANAAFHLDRLVADRLLDVDYRRLSGRVGPGAGRPAKLYRRSDREIAVNLPPRAYDVAGDVLATAVAAASRAGVPVAAVIDEVARAYGARLASRQSKGRGASRATLAGILAEHGYEPQLVGRRIELRNCPFHALADSHRELVCGMNRALLEGVLAGAGARRLDVVPDPQPGRCCVAVTPRKEN